MLDATPPLRGWWDRINLEKFDITHRYHCILGQLYTDGYHVGRDALVPAEHMGSTSLVDQWAIDHGFLLGPYIRPALEQAWRDVIMERRSQ